MRTAAPLLLWLAAISAATADEKVESVVSGTVTIQMVPANPTGNGAGPDVPQAGQLIVRFGPKKADAVPDELERCGKAWNAKLAEHNNRLMKAKAASDAALRNQAGKPLTRYQYREFIYRCLEPPLNNAGPPEGADVRPPGS